ncbi:YciI family protein [Massilia horti]|uniref:YciI family protein n=1 Tax=Massilia horti TaxID=2562153 RepID=A0A4Y9SVI5_9BURK|nr:YciI family protein [Massilia horti]TFW29517.1 YciI family protein [Massilia horti]
MRFAILLKADKDTEAGKMPGEEMFAKMAQFNQELIDAGIMQAGEGLQPSSRGARVKFTKDGKVSVVDGPFAETKELIAGFWIWKCKSKEEAIEWVKRVPMPMESGEAEIEIRQVFEAEDFGEEFTPELRELEERQREQLARQS